MYRILLATALMISVPSVAIPCGNAIQLSGDEATKLVKKAEKQLERGKPAQALRTLHRRYRVTDDNLAKRVRLLRTVAAMRTGLHPQA
ncbi:MAG: hypothetical protein AAGC55_25600, partial [Myxococcota bacterium]